MRRTQKAIRLAGLGLMFAALLGGAVEARHRGHHQQLDPDSAEAAMRGPPVHDGPLGTMMVQFIKDCRQQASELKNFPADEIGQTIAPDTSQADELKNVRRVATDAADSLAQNCPQDVPADPAGRLDSFERGVDAVETVADTLKAALQTLDHSLSDDQKRRLTRRFVDPSKGRGVETTGSIDRANRPRRHRRRITEDTFAADAPPAAQAPWNCEQWQAELRAWPLERVEDSIAVGPRQRAAFYELAAAIQRAADRLADACPQQVNDSALTPIERIDELKKKLESLRQSIATIRPALDRFYGVLEGSQKMRFNDAI